MRDSLELSRLMDLTISEDVDEARRLDRAGRRIDVLILVKATPQPSQKYGDTVCVAGIALDPGPARWVRLYPVPFRYIGTAQQFKKYAIVSVKVRHAGQDAREESLKIDAESIVIGAEVPRWSQRSVRVQDLPEISTCEAVRRVGTNLHSSSLALVRPREVDDISFTEHGSWSDTQLAGIAAHQANDTLFEEEDRHVLEPPRFKASLHYHCEDSACSGHRQRILDWELTALQSKLLRRGWSDDEVRSAIRRNFLETPFASDRDPRLFLGNQENPTRRRQFTVLGVYYPRTADAQQAATLF